MEKNSVLSNLQPASVFHFFEELSAIPHGSGHTKAISDYCKEFAVACSLPYRQDEHDNIIIFKPASKGYEDHPTVMIQGHLDMVCAKEPDCTIDMEKDGLSLAIDGDWVHAKGTTLGADNGIAVAMGLAVLDDSSLVHPPLEIVFTSDEEIGLLGAASLDCSDLKSKLMLNIDSEDEGVFTVGCAGGARCDVKMECENGHGCGVCCILHLKDFDGGHSGIEIQKGRGNTNHLCGEILSLLSDAVSINLQSLSGGKFDNAIANDTKAVFLLPYDQRETARSIIEKWWAETKANYAETDPHATLSYEDSAEVCGFALSEEDTKRIASLLKNLPSGVLKMSEDMPGLVETSANLGIVKLTQNTLDATVSVRSSVNATWKKLIEEIGAIGAAHGCTSSHRGAYPGWEYQRESTLRPAMVSLYQELYGKEPVVETIHAGLECGLFSEKMPGLDCVSFGPDLRDVHTPKERMSISSVARTYTFLTTLLSRL